MEFFKDNDLKIITAVYSERLPVNIIQILKKIDDNIMIINNPISLGNYIKGVEDDRDKIGNISYMESNNTDDINV